MKINQSKLTIRIRGIFRQGILMLSFVLLIISLFFVSNNIKSSFAQAKKELLYSNRFSILAGMIQPTLLKGGNIELNYFSKRMSVTAHLTL